MPAAPKHSSKHHRKPNPTSNPSNGSGNGGSGSAGPSRSPHTPHAKPMEERDQAGVPGISKLKASIRQTKRLLAKDNLQPGLRIQTQRRLTSLENDLARAERRTVEKKNGGKYHMVKFFERQKLRRIIKRYKKKLSDETLKASKRAKMEGELEEARVLLNYILHFPNEQKYISLFPPASNDAQSTASGSTTSEPEGKLSLPPLLHPAVEPTDKGEKRRLEILRSIEGMMGRGEISKTPEDEARGGSKKVDVVVSQEGGKEKGKKAAVEGVEEADDFFEDEDEEE